MAFPTLLQAVRWLPGVRRLSRARELQRTGCGPDALIWRGGIGPGLLAHGVRAAMRLAARSGIAPEAARGPLHGAVRQMGQLGYMQWIAGLPGDADYLRAAFKAHDMAAPFMMRSPAIAEFCALLPTSLETPLRPLPLAMPPRQRRGGAHARRSSRTAL